MNRLPGKSAYAWLFACIVWALAVLVLSLMAHPLKLPLPLLSWDKLQHASAYALLTFLAGYSWSRLWPGRQRVWGWAAGCAMLFGICMELLQGVMHNGRTSDPRDALANATGIFVAILLVRAWRSLRNSSR